MIQVVKYPSGKQLEQLFARPSANNASVAKQVQVILANVKKSGDKALKEYSKKFDGIALNEFLVSKAEINSASRSISKELKTAIQVAYKNIAKFHLSQKEKAQKVETMPGVVCWRKSVPVENVGLYIPGGSAPLFSTVLMLGIPAQIAGCSNIVLCSPLSGERKDASINEAILYTAKLCGITNIYKVGGAQAIAAMAYGTESIPKVDKIFGPGNQFVTAAKQFISNEGVAIDLPAGPSELCVIADETCIPEFVAADLLSQAEHGSDSQVILLSTKETVLKACLLKVQELLNNLPRKLVAVKALSNSSGILVKNIHEAVELANMYAPEHLILACKNSNSVAEKVKNAGSIFIGNYSPESVGDYASGTNHTLPTSGYAKSYSGVSLDSFMKKITFQQLSKKGLNNIGRYVETMAEAEGLMAHKLAVSVRKRSY